MEEPGYLKKIKKLSGTGYVLYVWDIDDTLLTHKHVDELKILIYDNKGFIVKALTPSEYNYWLDKDSNYYNSGESTGKLSFINFKKAGLISKAHGIKQNIEIARDQLNSSHSFFMTLTARSKMDDKFKFLKAMKDFGLDLNLNKSSHAVFAGEISLNKKIASDKAKAEIIEEALKTGKFKQVHMYDDHRKNLAAFIALQKQFNRIEFQAWLVDNNGTIKPY
jgi:hypothetical protein